MLRNNWADGEAFTHLDQNDVANEVNAKVEKALLTAKGDLVAASNSGTPERLPVGTDGQLLIASSGQTTGLTWTSTIPQSSVLTLTEDLSAVNTALGQKEVTANKGQAGGYVPLNSSTKIDATYLPSYVDDVLEFDTAAEFPGTGETGKIYVARDTNDTYRWSGSQYVRISDRILAAGITDSTEVGRAVLTAADTAAARLAIALNNVDNTSDATKVVASAAQLTTARTINGVSFDGTANITVADATKEPVITAGTTTQYWRGDKSWQTLDVAAVSGAEATANKGQANGYAALDATGKVPDAQLPNTVNDVVEFATMALFPSTGETGRIYVDQSTNYLYRWTGTDYAQVGGTLAATQSSYATTIGNGVATTFTLTHNLGTLDVVIGVWETATGTEVNCDKTRTNTNTVTLGFAEAPASNAYRVVIFSGGVPSEDGPPLAPVSWVRQTLTETQTLANTAGYHYIVLLADGAVATLPTAVDNEARYTLKNIHTADRTVATTATQTVEGLGFLVLSPGASVELVSDGANWRII